jgi:hypothetical protein
MATWNLTSRSKGDCIILVDGCLDDVVINILN